LPAGTSPPDPDIGADRPARLFRRKQASGWLPPDNGSFFFSDVERVRLLPRRGNLPCNNSRKMDLYRLPSGYLACNPLMGWGHQNAAPAVGEPGGGPPSTQVP
jgi:hypothetical protein